MEEYWEIIKAVMVLPSADAMHHIIIWGDNTLLETSNSSWLADAVLDAANGLQAWKILEDLTHHIDIVLTEVVMPCLSGLGLLYKIMSHKTRKNIPVISK